MNDVWILNHYAQVPSGVGGTRHYSLARALSAYGWRTSVIAASTDYNTGAQRLSEAEPCRIEHHGGVPFLWIRCPEYQGNGSGRMRNMLAYSWRVLRPRMLRDLPRPDVIIGSSVHPFAALSGALLARRYDVPFVFEVRDLWPQTLIDMGRIKASSAVAIAMRLLERWLYRRAERIVVLLPHANEYIEPLGIPSKRIIWIPNGVDLNDFRNPDVPRPSQVFTLMYLGAHGRANGLDNLLEAMRILSERSLPQVLRLRMIGDGPLKSELKRQAAITNLENVVFEPPVPKREIPTLMAQADAFVICVNDLPGLYRFGISMNKLFDYLAGARPIVIASNASNNPVKDANAGITVPPGNPVALADAIAALIEMPSEQRRMMGEAGRAYVEANHGFDRLGEKLAALLQEVLVESRVARV